jgi:hypothetical protein
MKSILSPTELQSSSWIKIKTYLNIRVEDLRKKNDGDFNEIDTSRMRGRIAEIKNMLAAVEPPPALESDEL